jgi:hypothetical protein
MKAYQLPRVPLVSLEEKNIQRSSAWLKTYYLLTASSERVPCLFPLPLVTVLGFQTILTRIRVILFTLIALRIRILLNEVQKAWRYDLTFPCPIWCLRNIFVPSEEIFVRRSKTYVSKSSTVIDRIRIQLL